ncbi:MAG: 2OG-Fe(II) oxygenase [Crocinitomicaceae bacterium]|nr:2OG-Fe(II) oxygenase [Crocinitomicaceae bacterium]
MAKISAAQWEQFMDELATQEYVVIDNFLDAKELQLLLELFEQRKRQNLFEKAAIGASGNEKIINEIRGDYTLWLNRKTDTLFEAIFLRIDEIKCVLNRLCMLSISDFEFHLAVYPKGSFYQKHYDQFNNRNNRLISVVLYLNENWIQGNGGELRIHKDTGHIDIAPLMNRLVLFRSDVVLHEVLVSNTERNSLTGWMLHQPSILANLY